ncbi:hypothetical protein ACP3V3_09265 [Vibrio sp. PNB22_3_1]
MFKEHLKKTGCLEGIKLRWKASVYAFLGTVGTAFLWVTDLTQSICPMLDNNVLCDSYTTANKDDFSQLEQRITNRQDEVLGALESALGIAKVREMIFKNHSKELADKLTEFEKDPSIENAEELFFMSQYEKSSLPLVESYLKSMLPQEKWEDVFHYGTSEVGHKNEAGSANDSLHNVTKFSYEGHIEESSNQGGGEQTSPVIYNTSSYSYHLNNYSETFSKTVIINDDFFSFIGVQVHTDDELTLGQSLYFFKPKIYNQIRFIIKSIDGAYTAEFNLNFTNPTAGWFEVELPTQYVNELLDYSQKELMANAYVEMRDLNEHHYNMYLPTAWGEPSDESPNIFINANETFPYYKVNNDLEACIEVKAKTKTTYTHQCPWSKQFTQGKNLIIINKGLHRVSTIGVWHE